MTASPLCWPVCCDGDCYWGATWRGSFLLFFVYISHEHWHPVLLIDYLAEFDISVSLVTVMLSLGSFCYCVATQISINVLVIKYTTRNVTTCAAILNFLATLLFATSSNVVIFFVANMIKYTAKGTTLIAIMILVGVYFRRRRGLATTLALLGMSTSFILTAPFIRYLREEYGFRGCFLILAGIEMHGVAAALLLRPLNSYKRKKVRPELSSVAMQEINPLLEKTNNNHSEDLQPIEEVEQLPLSQISIAEMPIEEADEMSSDESFIQTNLSEKEDVHFNGNTNFSNGVNDKIGSDIYPDVVINYSTGHDEQKEHNDRNNLFGQWSNEDGLRHKVIRQKTMEDTINVNSDKQYDTALTDDITDKCDGHIKSKNISEHSTQDTKSQNIIFDRKKTSESNSIAKSQSSARHSQPTYNVVRRTSQASNWSLVTSSSMGSTLNIPHVIEAKQFEHENSDIRLQHCQWVKELFDFSLLKNYIAVMVVVMYVLSNTSSFSVVYLPSYAKGVGVTSQSAAILLTIIGAMDIIGRLFFGFLADLKCVRPYIIVALSSACIGIVTHFIVILDGFEKLVFFGVIHGFLAGAGHNFTTVLIIDVLDIQRLSKMLSINSMFNSVSFVIQYPIHGAVIEATGNFVVTYHYVGTNLILACFLLLCETLIRKLQLEKEKKQELKQASRNYI